MQVIVNRVWADGAAIYIETADGKIYSEHFADYSRLRNATPTQRAQFEYDNIGIRWDNLNEDLCYEGFVEDRKLFQK